MKIKLIELTEINLPLVHFFETSFGRTYERRIILTRVVDDAGAERAAALVPELLFNRAFELRDERRHVRARLRVERAAQGEIERAAEPLRRKRGLLPEGHGRGTVIKSESDEFVHKRCEIWPSYGLPGGNFHAQAPAVKANGPR